MAVLEGVEKPGNVGAVLRSADAAGVSAVIVADARTDLYNPNAIRASLGTIFTMPVCEAASGEVLAWLRQRKLRIFAARVDGAVPYTEVDYRGPTAIVLGSEAAGLSPVWTRRRHHGRPSADARRGRQPERFGHRRGALLRGAAASGKCAGDIPQPMHGSSRHTELPATFGKPKAPGRIADVVDPLAVGQHVPAVAEHASDRNAGASAATRHSGSRPTRSPRG